MRAIELTTVPSAARRSTTLGQLAALEIRRYARHPLFIIAILLTVQTSLGTPIAGTSSYYNVIVPTIVGSRHTWDWARAPPFTCLTSANIQCLLSNPCTRSARNLHVTNSITCR
jgi:hypothetical protein